jgi:pyruvate dehydrogenase E1 component alpha subunit
VPRERVELEGTLDHLSILDEDGNVDESLEPELSDELLLRMHDKMLLARMFDERMLSLQRQGRIGTFAPVRGQEASQIGSVAALDEPDWVVPSYREIAVAVWRGLPLEGMLLYNAGYNEGGAIPDDQRVLPNSVPVGSQMLHAAGLAYGLHLRGEDAVVMTYFGDGATSEGDFHEALNFAGVFESPCVFVCQNNRYAISVPREHQTRSATLAQKAFAYGLPGVQVDGNDVLAVHVAVGEAVERARAERRPTLVECLTYRLGVHTTVDDPSKYRDDAEVEAWEARDPIPRFQGYLRTRELLDDERLGKAKGAAEEAIRAAVERWEDAMASASDPSMMFDHVYASPTRDLQAQREAFESEWPARADRLRREEEDDRADDGGTDTAESDEEGADEGGSGAAASGEQSGEEARDG